MFAEEVPILVESKPRLVPIETLLKFIDNLEDFYLPGEEDDVSDLVIDGEDEEGVPGSVEENESSRSQNGGTDSDVPPLLDDSEEEELQKKKNVSEQKTNGSKKETPKEVPKEVLKQKETPK